MSGFGKQCANVVWFDLALGVVLFIFAELIKILRRMNRDLESGPTGTEVASPQRQFSYAQTRAPSENLVSHASACYRSAPLARPI